VQHDYHVHSTYSDGRFLYRMVRAAAEAELAGVGIADHCNVSERDRMRSVTKHLGFNLDVTYERRREAIGDLRERFDIAIHDAVELDYDMRDEDAIRAFLAEADFDYAIGSVHFLDDVNVHVEPYFADESETDRDAYVDQYFDNLVALAESELFDIAAHVDLVERNPALRGYATEEQYHRAAEAFANSHTVPEINAGRVLSEYGEFHPTPEFLEILLEHDVEFTLGTDSHEPDEIAARKERIETLVATHGIDPVTVHE